MDQSIIEKPITEQIIEDPTIDLWYIKPVEWLKGLRYFIHGKILTKCFKLGDPNMKDNSRKLVSEDAMKIWRISFTHSSANSNGTENYETLEHMGDTSMKTAFDSAVIQKYPGISEYLITLLNNIYVSKPIQRQKSEELGLYKWLRTIVPANISIHEDLLESLFGALFNIGDRVLGGGNGYVLCRNLAAYIYDIESIDIDQALAHPKSAVKEIIEKMHWHEGKNLNFVDIETVKKTKDGWQYELRLPVKAIEYLKENNLPHYPDGLFSRVDQQDKKTAMDAAYASGAEYLKVNYGITREWAFEEANKEMIEGLPKITVDRMKKDGYERIDYDKYYIQKITYIQLVGVDKTDYKTILITVSTEKKVSQNVLRMKAAELYGTYGRQPLKNIYPIEA